MLGLVVVVVVDKISETSMKFKYMYSIQLSTYIEDEDFVIFPKKCLCVASLTSMVIIMTKRRVIFYPLALIMSINKHVCVF